MNAFGDFGFWPIVALVFATGIAGGFVLFYSRQGNVTTLQQASRKTRTSSISTLPALFTILFGIALISYFAYTASIGHYGSTTVLDRPKAPLASVPYRLLGEVRTQSAARLAITMDSESLFDRHMVQQVLSELERRNHDKAYLQIMGYATEQLQGGFDDDRNVQFLRFEFWRNRLNGNSEFVWFDIDAITAKPSRYIRIPDTLRPR